MRHILIYKRSVALIYHFFDRGRENTFVLEIINSPRYSMNRYTFLEYFRNFSRFYQQDKHNASYNNPQCCEEITLFYCKCNDSF